MKLDQIKTLGYSGLFGNQIWFLPINIISRSCQTLPCLDTNIIPWPTCAGDSEYCVYAKMENSFRFNPKSPSIRHFEEYHFYCWIKMKAPLVLWFSFPWRLRREVLTRLLAVRDEGDTSTLRSSHCSLHLALFLHSSDQSFIVKINKIFLDKTMIHCWLNGGAPAN